MQQLPFIRWRMPILAITLLLLLGGLWAGLIRIGWGWPVVLNSLPLSHGPLMVSGFLGTLIGIERAVALGRRWMYLGPTCSGIGGLLLAFGTSLPLGATFIFMGSLLLCLVFTIILRIEWVNYTRVMALGALSWLIGNLIWLLGLPVSSVVYWWAAFLILTIAGERLELGRLLRLSTASLVAFRISIALILAGQVFILFEHISGTIVYSLGLLALGIWLLRNDVARVTVQQQGLPRFIAYSLLAGYVWLLVSGLLGLINGSQTAGFLYDAFLHAIFIGFVFSMIFGHAPIIFPAIVGRQAVYQPRLYIPLALLHLSLVLRLIGDMLLIIPLRAWGGLTNALAILLFFGMMISILRRSSV